MPLPTDWAAESVRPNVAAEPTSAAVLPDFLSSKGSVELSKTAADALSAAASCAVILPVMSLGLISAGLTMASLLACASARLSSVALLCAASLLTS